MRIRLTRDGRLERTDIWREGKWIDLWSIVHFLSGISFGLGIYFLKLGTISSIIIVLLLLVGYEMWEAMVKIEETPQNRFMDIVVGMASFLPIFLYLSPILPTSHLILLFGLVLTFNVVLATSGWLESRKADELEKKLRADLQQRRARFIADREKRRLRRTEGHR
jgi:hypothetical protein